MSKRSAAPGSPTRWATDTGPEHSQWYVDRFRQLAAEGADLAGEARLVDALVPPRSRILDAGCGTGRVGAELAARGHTVVGVDADPVLVEAARADHPGPRWLVADLTTLDLAAAGEPEPFDAAVLDLAAAGEPEPFDAAVLAGNVMTFVAAGTEVAVLRQVAAHVRPDGVIAIGFGTDRGYPLADFDAHVAAAGLRRDHRFATWDLRPWHDDADFAVTVLRRPA
ncbi:class I SAM-dependent methyltransferase [Micromonospora maris]|uniref:class I SAM-dependent methyltransferase n=1 Tax=Micromonospora maris TaxID=1003110 RepID=UPI002E14CCA3|nr:class I SAM-dependent methyltransferase [Micromonospora maris]